MPTHSESTKLSSHDELFLYTLNRPMLFLLEQFDVLRLAYLDYAFVYYISSNHLIKSRNGFVQNKK